MNKNEKLVLISACLAKAQLDKVASEQPAKKVNLEENVDVVNVVLQEIGSSSEEEEDDDDENDEVNDGIEDEISSRVGGRVTTFRSRRFFGDSD